MKEYVHFSKISLTRPGAIIPIMQTKWLCHKCEGLLFKGELGAGTVIEIRCRKCGKFTTIKVM